MWRITNCYRRSRERRRRAAAERQIACFPLIASPRPHGLSGELIVSLTSHPPRFVTLAKTLKCLLDQTVAADRTILWLGYGDQKMLPQEVLDLKRHGLEILECPQLGSFKKIIPTLKLYPNSFIITADDDLYYDTEFIHSFLVNYDPLKNDIIGRRAHLARIQDDGALSPYRSWDLHTSAHTDKDLKNILFLTSGSGVLYPPKSLHPMVLDETKFMRLCPYADDLWLFWMARRAETLMRRVGMVEKLLTWEGSQENGLSRKNFLEGRNDTQIRAIEEELGLIILE